MSERDDDRHEPAPGGTEPAALTAKQEAAALLLAAGRTYEQAAAEAHCGVRSLKRWNATVPAFAARVRELRHEMTQAALGALVHAMQEAALTLNVLLRSKSDTVKLGAARAVFEMGARLRESAEVAQVIDALKSRVEQLEGRA